MALKTPLVLLTALCLIGCAEQPTTSGATTFSSTVEFQDIFIPERLVEIPVLPAGTSVIHEVYIHNAGDRDLTIEEIRMDSHQSDENWLIIDDTIPSLIRPHEHAVLEVSYVAAAEVATFAAIDIYSDDPDEGEKTIAFIGHQASGGAEARVSASVLDWGFRFRGEESRQTLLVRNEGEEDLHILGVELVQSGAQPAFSIACPGQALDACDWAADQQQGVLDAPVSPGSAALFELAFVPLNLQGTSAQLKIQTSDPLRPEFTVFLLGNGDSALNCTPPIITVTSPSEATFHHEWQEMTVTARVFDQEQPSDSMYVEMFLGDVLIEDEFPDENGFVTFVIDINDHSPPLPNGLQPFTLRVTDGCQLFGFDTFVAAIDFPLSPADTDGDGFDPNQGDCNDNNGDMFPQNIEVHDGLDNDCDGTIDEGTGVWDDDCDGYCETPPCLGQGPAPTESDTCGGLAADAGELADCNDSVVDLDGDGITDGAGIYPSATEGLNFIDDDCDGTTDEGTTFFDDDGDGQTEVVGDCDDEDPAVFQGAVEWCDGIDNDCDGAIDSGCIEETAPPRVVGGVMTSRFQVQLGARIEAEVLIVSSDPMLTYEWYSDMGGAFDDPADGSRVFWNAPADTDANLDLVGQFPTLMVTVTDSEGREVSAFGNVHLGQDVSTTYAPAVAQSTTDDAGGCSQGGATNSAPARFLLLPVLAVLSRRRRD